MKIRLNILIKNRLLCLLFLLSPSIAWANTGQNMLTSVLSGLIGVLTSTPARLMFVVAIIGVGYGTLALGKIPKEKAVAIVIGIGIVFSASFIAQKMGLGT
jgi:type IV secretory pathway VirB2 component (pilin)